MRGVRQPKSSRRSMRLKEDERVASPELCVFTSRATIPGFLFSPSDVTKRADVHRSFASLRMTSFFLESPFGIRFPGKQSPAELRRDGVVQLHQDDGGDAVIRPEEAQGGAGGVERLGDDDSAYHGGMKVGGAVVGKQVMAGRVNPAKEEHESE